MDIGIYLVFQLHTLFLVPKIDFIFLKVTKREIAVTSSLMSFRPDILLVIEVENCLSWTNLLSLGDE